MKILVLNGPNLDVLHRRDPAIYGGASLADVEGMVMALGAALGVAVECVQSNHEGVLIDRLNHLDGDVSGVILNPGGFTHTSVALMDSVEAATVPVIEVHLSNIDAREELRRTSLVGRAAAGRIIGLGVDGYCLALRALAGSDRKREQNVG
ncbi:MAG: type II 3-dehydroquinate dehydratase [Pseudomonadota bacterium]